jgi:hypothetical protein
MSPIRPGPNALIGRGVEQKIIRRRGKPEDDMMRNQVEPLLRSCGFDGVYHTSARHKVRGVTPGIADLMAFHPGLALLIFQEGKVGRNRQEHDQLLFQERCAAAGQVYILGDVTATEDFLLWVGLAYKMVRPHRLTGERIIQALPAARVSGLKVPGFVPWHKTVHARLHQERWGWNPTVGALKPLLGRRRKVK